jgi:uncharacterized protein
VRWELFALALTCALVQGAPAWANPLDASHGAPAYVDASRFTNRPLTIGRAPFVRNATLTMPIGVGPFPAVVLVHGESPATGLSARDFAINSSDRNQPANDLSIFQDLAEGLASQGVAVLSYDQRAGSDGQPSTTITVDVADFIDDAVVATRLIAVQPGIDPSRVFVLGHGLGGKLAPEIAARAGNVAGLVLLAPPARAPWDIVLEQLRAEHAPSETITAVERVIRRIDRGSGAGTSILGMPFTYWHDWASHDGLTAARTLARPILIVHGDRDNQVIDEDRAIWQCGLAGVANTTIITLAGLNHLFMQRAVVAAPAGAGGTTSTAPAKSAAPTRPTAAAAPADAVHYTPTGHVDASVLELIGKFIIP